MLHFTPTEFFSRKNDHFYHLFQQGVQKCKAIFENWPPCIFWWTETDRKLLITWLLNFSKLPEKLHFSKYFEWIYYNSLMFPFLWEKLRCMDLPPFIQGNNIFSKIFNTYFSTNLYHFEHAHSNVYCAPKNAF